MATQRSPGFAKSFFRRISVLARMVKIEHSIFALPFAYIGAFVAAGGWPGWRVFLFLTVAMVAVRSFAMAVNRVLDLPFDRINPRTADRPLVTGEITVPQAWTFIGIAGVVFVLACAGMNTTALLLSPPALLWSGFYSLTKRWTWLCHFVLGSVLGLAPIAGWIGYEPSVSLVFVLFFLGVLFWVAGFDILYSCQDVQFDLEQGLHSVPARFGVPTALAISSFSHVNSAVFFLLAGLAAGLGWMYLLSWTIVSAVLFWQHTLVKPDDLSRVNLAFFTVNGGIAIFLFLGVLLDLFW